MTVSAERVLKKLYPDGNFDKSDLELIEFVELIKSLREGQQVGASYITSGAVTIHRATKR